MINCPFKSIKLPMSKKNSDVSKYAKHWRTKTQTARLKLRLIFMYILLVF